MNPRLGDETDDYCTRCHRLTNHSVAAIVGESIAETECRTCGFRHVYKGGQAPQRSSKPKPSAFDQVLAGILADPTKPAAAEPRSGRRGQATPGPSPKTSPRRKK